MRFPLSLFRRHARGKTVRQFQLEPLEVRALLAIDLQVLDFSVPASAVVGNGEQVALSWTVQNNGDEATTANFWFDSIYVSDDAVFDPADEVLHFVTAGETSLGPGDSYTFNELVTMPNTAAGNRFLILAVDETELQVEEDDVNNVASAEIVLTNPDVDLTITSFTSPVAEVVAGQPFLLKWSIDNTGSDNAAAPRTDRVYLSTDDFFDFGDEVIFEEVRTDGMLALGTNNGSALVTIPESYEPGTYYLFVGIDEFNEQSETNNFNNGTALPLEIVTHGPDFAVDLLETDGTLTPGTIEDVTYTVTNTGNFDAELPFWVGFYLSVDNTLSGDDWFVGADDVSSELPLGHPEDFTRVVGLSIPAGMPGNVYLLAVADFAYDVSELQESNNVLASAVFVEAPAVIDVSVSDLQAPASVVLGSTVEVSYYVTNNGSATIASSWNDRFYISDDATLDEFDVQVDPNEYVFSLGLGVGESELVQRSITIQNASLGSGKYLLVQVGIGLTDDNPSDNVAAFQLDVVAPDLAVTAFTAPTTVSVNQQIAVAWTVTNVGSAIYSGNWQDRIYLSTDATLSQFDTVLDLAFRSTPVGVGGDYSFNRTISIPDFAAGEYYLFVRAIAVGPSDFDGGNNVAMVGPITIGKPDLLVSQFDAPTIARAGDTISVTYTVLNDSDTAMGTSSIVDRFSLSNDPVLGLDDDFLDLIQIGSDTLPLSAHGTYQRTVNLQLPPGVHGSKYLILRTDTFVYQGETNEANNDFVQSIEIVAADLVVEDLIVPASITFGTSFEVTYTVRNNGTGSTNQTSWYDRIALTSTVDATSVILSDLLITLNEPLAAGASYTRTIVANVPPIGNAGDYRIGVAADIAEDQVELDENNNVRLSDPLPVILPPVPNVETTGALVPVEGISGQQFALTWTVTNLGTAPVVGPWSDRATIDGLQLIDLGLFSFNGTLLPGESITRTEYFEFPELEGTYFVAIYSDFENDLLEGPYEANTYFSSTFNVVAPPLPDLAITNMVQPGDGVFSGSTVPITFTVTNVGAGATLVPAWTDFVFISTNSDFVYPDPLGDDLPIIGQPNPLITRPNLSYLAPGESYTQTVDVTIPLNAAGTWYVYVFPNGLGEFYSVPASLRESNRTNNLTRSDGFQVNLTPPPDLVVSQAIAPLQSFSGQPVNVQWTTINSGFGATVATVWADRIYLSLDDVLDQTDVLLSTNNAQVDFVHLGRLEPGQSYIGAATVVLPDGISGAYRLLVVADGANSVFEAGVEENNVGVRVTTINLTPPPDLVVDLITSPSPVLAAHALEVTYTITNRGNTPTPTANSLDRIYLSSDTILDDDDLQLSEVWGFTGVLSVDESYTRTRSVTLPAGIEGQYYLIVSANANDTIFEIDRANNSLSRAIEVDNVPPNLQVINVTTDPVLVAGEVATVEWTVRNAGPGDTGATRWIDKVYLSTNGTTSGGVLLGYFVHIGVLGPNETYTRQVGVTIPFDVPQGAGIYVVTDAVVTDFEASLQLPPTGAGGNVYEGAHENDNTSAVALASFSRILPDLAVTDSMFNVNPLEPGATVEAFWTVTNQGGRTNSDHWIDDLYLSLDANLSADDILLGSMFHSGTLENGQSYATVLTVNLPVNLAAGNYHLILQVDRLQPKSMFDPLVNLVYEDASEANNIATNLIQLTEGFVPDLVVSNVQAPTAPIAGRTLDVSWTVTNISVATGDRSWRDAVYLSLDQFLDPATDRFIGYHTHVGGLLSFGQYTAGSSFAIPGGLTGPYYVFVRSDVNDVIYERGSEGNNTAYDPSAILIQLGQPVDFTVGLIEVPVTAIAGASATIGYTITNNVNLPVPGGWTDSIYLSADDVWDAGDVLFAQVPHPGDLAAGESYSQLVNKALPILAPGNYHVIIRTDVYNTVAEMNETNNLGVSLDVAAVDATQIDLGIPRVDALTAGGFVLYRVDVPAGETLRFSWDSAFNSVSTELYVRYGTPPTRNNFDLQSTLHFQADHEIFVPTSKAGTYYVLVHANAGNASGTVLVESLPFSLVAASPGQVGNAGNATIEITGALFTHNTTFELVGPGGELLPAQFTMIESASKAYATFDLKGKAIGQYDLVAYRSNGWPTATLEDTVEVVESLAGGQLNLGATAPPVSLPNTLDNFQVTISNTGNNDVAVPLVIIHSLTGTVFGQNLPVKGPGESLVFYAAQEHGPAGILRPGQSTTMSFVFRNGPVAGEDYTFEITLGAEDDPTLIDWVALEELFAPNLLTAADYPQVLAQLQSQIGTTTGDFVRMLSRNANLATSHELAQNDGALLSIEVDRAIAAVRTSVSGRLITDDADVDFSDRTVMATNVDTNETIVRSTLRDGSFIFEDLPAGTYRLDVDGVYVYEQFVSVFEGDHLTDFELYVQRGARLTGRVLDGVTPIVGAVLSLTGPDNMFATAISDEQGNFVLSGVLNDIYTLSVDAEGYGRYALAGVDLNSGDSTITVVLTDQSVILGNVSLAPGGPLETEMTVFATPTSANPDLDGAATVVLGSTFRLEELASGTYDIDIVRPGYVTARLTNITVGPGETLNLGNILLARAAIIRGTLESTDPEVPIDDAAISIMDLDGNVVAMADTAPDGSFVIDTLPPGTYRVNASGAAFIVPDVEVTVVAGENSPILLSVYSGGKIAGTVFDSKGETVRGGMVTLLRNGELAFVALTDNLGSFEFGGLLLGEYDVFIAGGGSQSRLSFEVTTLHNQYFQADLVVQLVAEIVGQLLDFNGQPFDMGEVRLMQDGRTIATAQTDDLGNYRFLLGVAGTYDLLAVTPNGAFQQGSVTLAPGDYRLFDFHAGNAALRVSVTTNGNPAAGAIAGLFVDVDGELQVVTAAELDENGEAFFVGLVPGNYLVKIVSDSGVGASASVSLVFEEEGFVSLATVPMATIAGTVTDGLNGIGEATVVVLDPLTAEVVARGYTDVDGNILVPAVDDGVYDVVVFADGYEFALQTGVALAGSTPLSFVLTASTSELLVRVLDESNQPVPFATVEVRDAAGRLIAQGQVDATGQASISTALGADLTVTVLAEGFSDTQVADVTVAAGQTDLGTVPLTSIVVAATPPAVIAFSAGQGMAFSQAAEMFSAATSSSAWGEQIRLKLEDLPFLKEKRDALFARPPICPECEDDYDNAVKTLKRFDSAFKKTEEAAQQILYSLNEFEKAAAQIKAKVNQIKKLDIYVGSTDYDGLVRLNSDFLAFINGNFSDTSSASEVDSLLQQNHSQANAYARGLGNLINDMHARNIRVPAAYGSLIDMLNDFRATLNSSGILEKAQQVEADEKELDNLIRRSNKLLNAAKVAVDKLDKCNDEHRTCFTSFVAFTKSFYNNIIKGQTGGRIDPNEIVGPEGYGDPRFVPGAQSLSYTIRFENLEAATLPVQNLTITTQLDADLDFRTVRFGGFGWGEQSFQFASDKPFLNERVDLTATLGFYVDVVATIDVETGLATWTLTAIDPATGLEPLDERIGFLPPNDDAHIGEGFVTYSARPKTGLDTGTVIDAQATIIFDTEAPLDTPVWSNKLDVDAPSSQLDVLPVESTEATFLLSWTADDVVGGSGLATTTILVSENGGAFRTLFVAEGVTRQFLFEGTHASSYRFVSVATDNAGNRESATVADAITTVFVNSAPTVVAPIANVNEDEDAADTVLDISTVFGDIDIGVGGDSLVYAIMGNSNTDLVTASLDGTTLTLDYAANQHGTSTITIRATDLAGEWVEDTFLVTIDSVNDDPTVATPIANINVDEDAPNTVIDVSGTFADVDIATDADSLTYSVTGNTNAGLVTTSFDGANLTLDYVGNQHGTATITVRATDESGEWVETSFLVTVDPANDDPTVATPIANVFVDEDAPNTVIDFASTFADVDIATDADSLTFSVEENTNTGLVSVSLVGSALTLDYLPNQHGTATITVRATDEAGEWVETSFLVTVNTVGVELPFSDDFNRADSTSLGNDWVETLGNLGLTSQQVVLYQNTESTAILNDLLVADVSIEAAVDLTGAEVGRSIALMARSQGPGDQNAYWGVYYRSDSGYAAQIYKNIGGVPTPLRSVNVPGPAGTMRFEVFGTTLNLYFNDTLVTSVIDDSLLGAGAVGVRQTGGALDNFAAEVAVPPLSENALFPFTDNFNRADNSLFGSVWTERSGDTGVRGNKAGLYANDTSVVTLNGVLQADVSISADIDITSVPAQFSSGLLARYSGPGDSNTYMARMYRSDGGIFAAQVWKNVGGAYTPLRSVIVPSGAGTLRFDVVGDQLQLYFNGSLVASTIDSSITGPGQVGMRLAGGTLDNFSASELVPEPSSDAELPFLDNFARANGSSLGEFWTERAGDLGLNDGQLVLMAGETSVATLNGISAADVEVKAEVDIVGGGNAGLLARYSGPGDANAYMALMQAGSGGSYAAQIWKNIGAGWVNLTHSALATGEGELRFALNGTHLQLFFDDVLVGDIIDSSITAAGTVGVRQGGGSIDDFATDALVGIDGFFSDELFEEDEDWTFDEKFAEIIE